VRSKQWYVSVNAEKKAVKSLFASDSQNSDNADELLGLCSGQFSGGGAPWRDPSAPADAHRGLFTPDSTNNDCLLDVLSGRFTSTQASHDDHYTSRSACCISVPNSLSPCFAAKFSQCVCAVKKVKFPILEAYPGVQAVSPQVTKPFTRR